MKRSKLAWAAALLLLLLAAQLLTNLRGESEQVKTTSEQVKAVNVPIEMDVATSVKVQVYRGGQLVAEQEKVGDRLLNNFWVLVLNSFLGRYYNSPLAIYRVDGGTFTQPDWDYLLGGSTANPSLAVGFGSGGTDITFFDFELPSRLARVDVPSTAYSLTDNGTHIIVTASGSWTASSAATVADVGLYWRGYSYGSSTAFYVLIARDTLPTPIAVQANDVVIATYTITIAYNRPPFLKNLAALIANYILGARNYGRAVNFVTWGGTSTTVMDIGYDYRAGGTLVDSDNVQEYLYIGVTSDTRPYMPAMNSVSILAETASYVTVLRHYNSTHVWFRLSAATILLPNGGTVTGVFARIRDTDITSGSGINAQQVMVLYFPLDQPVTVPAGSGVKVEFTIYFRW
ncbi:MAG: hypothetical protein QW324_04925 [Thermofilaceae archaeon]